PRPTCHGLSGVAALNPAVKYVCDINQYRPAYVLWLVHSIQDNKFIRFNCKEEFVDSHFPGYRGRATVRRPRASRRDVTIITFKLTYYISLFSAATPACPRHPVNRIIRFGCEED